MTRLFESFVESKESLPPDFDIQGMTLALQVAESAVIKGDRSIGAVIAWPNKHLKEHDTTQTSENPLNEAGLNVINKALSVMPHKMKGGVLYSTLEPDALTVLTAYKSGIQEVVFGAYDHKDGFVSSVRKLNLEYYDIAYKGGVLSEECYKLLPKSVQGHSSVTGNL